MLVFAPLDLQVIDDFQTKVTYYKLFPLIVQDFLTRLDSKQMMSSDNLNVLVNAGQSVSVQVGPAPGTGSTSSPGSGNVLPVYNGSFKNAQTVAYEQQVKAAKEAGSASVESAKQAIAG